MSESSTEAAPVAEVSVANAASTPAPSVAPAESTPATERASLIDAVDKALNPSDKGVDAASPAAENRSQQAESKTQETPPPDGEPPDLSDEEKGQLSKKTQDRMRYLSSKVANTEVEVEKLRPQAERASQLDSYLQQNGITGEELRNTLALTSLIKAGRFEQAMEALEPVYQELAKRSGRVLDPDLQEEVRLGNTPLERAKELQALRARDTSRQQTEQVNTERQQVERWNAHVDSVAEAADKLAKQKALSDPDWAMKSPMLAEQVELDIRKNGFPKSIKEANERVENALKTVEERLKSFRPAPKAVQPNLGNGRASTPPSSQPKSARDAVFMALDGG